jgi:hypothetical protein
MIQKKTTVEALLKLGNPTVILAASKVEGKALVSFLCKLENSKTILAYLVKEPVLSANLDDSKHFTLELWLFSLCFHLTSHYYYFIYFFIYYILYFFSPLIS